VKASVQLGYPASAIVGIGIILLACTILYLIRGIADRLPRRHRRHSRSRNRSVVQHPVSSDLRMLRVGRPVDRRLQIVLTEDGNGR